MIRSSFSGFAIAQNAMQASQYALEVTGQNIANINTPGYTRQRLDLVSLNLKNAGYHNENPSNQVGFGVKISGISQIRDPFIDIQYRNEISKVGTADAKQATLDNLANIFDETESEGIRKALSDLSSSLDKLSANAGDATLDSIVRSRCQVLLDAIHSKGTDLADIKTGLEDEMEGTVKDANSLLEQISELNKTIYSSQVVGNPALELQDQRNNLIDQLASYLPIQVTYTPEKLATGTTVNKLSIEFKGGMETTGNTTSRVSIKLIDHDQFGSFKFEKADPGNATNPTTQASFSITGVGSATAKDVSKTLENGTFKGAMSMLNDSGELDIPPTDTRGLGYYEKTFNAFVDKFAKTFNDLNKVPLPDDKFKDVPLFTTTDPTATDFTSHNIQISKDWMSNKIKITTSKELNAPSTASDNVLNMIAELEKDQEFKFETNVTNPDGTTTLVTNVFYKGSFSSCYGNIENTQGIDSKANTAILKNHMSVLKETTSARDAVSGVSLDEEGMNLLHYQKSYSAAARFMTTLDEALDVLINKTGVVGR